MHNCFDFVAFFIFFQTFFTFFLPFENVFTFLLFPLIFLFLFFTFFLTFLLCFYKKTFFTFLKTEMIFLASHAGRPPCRGVPTAPGSFFFSFFLFFSFFFFFIRKSPARWGHPGGCPPAHSFKKKEKKVFSECSPISPSSAGADG